MAKFYNSKIFLVDFVQKMLVKSIDSYVHKFSTTQECQYCQFHFRFTIKEELDQWSLQPWNAILLNPLISILIFTNITFCKFRRKLQIYYAELLQ